MIPIENILYENGVEEIFKFIVPSGTHQGEYIIDKPGGWDDIDSTVDIDEDQFFVKNFIIGENAKLKFYQYGNRSAFDILEKVYEEQKGDGRIIFKYIGKKDNTEYDLLKDNMEVNMNKYNKTFGNSMFVIEVEIIKSEVQNKLFNRDEITIDLFDEKDLDENTIIPIETFEIGYKKGAKKQTNFYFWDTSQNALIDKYRTDHFFSFLRADGYEFGNNTNEYCGIRWKFDIRIDQGPFVSTNVTLESIKVEISNFHVYGYRDDNLYAKIALYAIIEGNNQSYTQKLLESTEIINGTNKVAELKIDNKTFDLNPPNLNNGQSLKFMILSMNNTDQFKIISVNTDTSIEISTSIESPLVKTTGIRVIDAIKQVVKNYTSSGLGVESTYLGPGGAYYNTSISTGVYLRGLPKKYTAGQKIKTSLKSLVENGVSKLLALGYDVLNNNVVVEDINYFFKDIQIYDLSGKDYIRDGFKIEIDKDVVFNNMTFGSKKYSKNVKEDIQNFITSAEFTTPIKSIKNKFDKQTELIIDEYKIQELIEDKTSSTNDNDDDLVLIDQVQLEDYYDTGIFEKCNHTIENGFLKLICTITAFDTTMITVGSSIEIMEGYNTGVWIVTNIDGAELTLNKNSGIQTGTINTKVKYLISSLIKNRSVNDGFVNPVWIRDPKTATNTRHNPKYHMARWFPFFGSGLIKKPDTDLIKVTNYKNNDKAQMTAIWQDLNNELQGEIIVGADESLGRLRAYKQPLFSGDLIEISIAKVTFEEFILIYENWRYGLNGDRTKNRGYLTINTPIGLYDVYPYGNAGLSHNRKNNLLSIKGKIKSKHVNNPVLISVNQIAEDTVKMIWNYSDEYVNPKISLQYSLDGNSWLTLIQIENIKESNLTSSLFNDIVTGDDVYFRILVSADDIINKGSNIISIVWV